MNIRNLEIVHELGNSSPIKSIKVKCISDYENNWGGCDQIKGNLTVGEIYTVEKTDVRSWHTKIYLKERPGKVFNSVHFEEVKPC